MKRHRTNLIAATLTGALAIAIHPAAQAEEFPAVTADARGNHYYLNQEGTHYLPDRELASLALSALTSEDREKAVDVSRAAVAGLISAGEAAAPSNATAADARATEVQDAPATEVKNEDVFGPEHVDPASDAPVAAGLLSLPPVLTVAEKTYYLNADGKTYVTEITRVQETPSTEEAAASQALLAQNGAEVARQALEAARAAGQPVEYAAHGAAAGAGAAAAASAAAPIAGAAPAVPALAGATERGIAAETGNNTVAKALFALVIASVIGAGVFAYGRRFLV